MSVYRQMGCFLQLNFCLIILLFSGSPTTSIATTWRWITIFLHLHRWGPLTIGDVLFSVEHRKEPEFILGQLFYSNLIQYLN